MGLSVGSSDADNVSIRRLVAVGRADGDGDGKAVSFGAPVSGMVVGFNGVKFGVVSVMIVGFGVSGGVAPP